MKTSTSQKNSLAARSHTPESTLTEWLTAIARFHSYHNLLMTCIGQGMDRSDLGLVSLHIGQCPLNQLTRLVTAMRKELEKLNRDMDQPGESDTIMNYGILTSHTRILNRLSQQAQSRLHLANLPSS